jgi:hypothetical protein
VSFVLGGFFAPFFWLFVMSVALWATRRFAPRWERPLFSKHLQAKPVTDFAIKMGVFVVSVWIFHAIFSK